MVAAAAAVLQFQGQPTLVGAPADTDMPVVEAYVEDEDAGDAAMPRSVVESEVREYFSDLPVMVDIAWCESKFTQYRKDGSVVRGVVTSDVGVMQINEYYHGKAAQELGLDLHDLEDNMVYARYLYKREGTKPWNSSAKCWRDGAPPSPYLARS